MYGVGAVVAGICIPLIMKYVKTEVSIVMTMCIYVISITAMIIEPSVMLLYGLAIFHAIGNAGTRVARNVLMMEEIPNEVMGRRQLISINWYRDTNRIINAVYSWCI